MDMSVNHKSFEWYKHIKHAPINLFLIQFSHLHTYWKQKMDTVMKILIILRT